MIKKISNFIKFTNIKDKHRFFISKKGKVSNFIFQISIVLAIYLREKNYNL